MQNRSPIAHFSTGLKGRTLSLSTYEKELMALVLAVQKWRPCLLGRSFLVRTDHRSLKLLWEQRIATEAQQKWLIKLLGYNFTVEYQQGKENSAADALSGRGQQADLAASFLPVPRWLDLIKEENISHPFIQRLHQLVQQNEAVGPWQVINAILFFKEKIYRLRDSFFLPTYWRKSTMAVMTAISKISSA